MMNQTIRYFSQGLRGFTFFTILTGCAYPFIVYSIGNILFRDQAQGSLIVHQNRIVGSELISQKFNSLRYFQSRPSASDYSATPSGASNQSPTSSSLSKAINERKTFFGAGAPSDILTCSGSGLDPHLSLESVLIQVSRVAKSRLIPQEELPKLEKLILGSVENQQLGFLGLKRINVLRLNIALDRNFP